MATRAALRVSPAAHFSMFAKLLWDGDLRDNRIKPGLRLEQELVTFGWLKAALDALPGR
jgi:hypothetical protein